MNLLKQEYKSLLVIFAIFLLNVFLFRYKMFSLYTDFGREAYFPSIIANGAVLYKDIFNTFICPFSYLFNALLIKIFGQNLNVFYTAGAINAFAILSGIYLISREFLNRNLSLAISLFIMFYCCFYTGLMNYLTPYSYGIVYGLCAVIFSILFFIKYNNTSDNFISSTDSDYLLNLCNKQVQYLTTSPAQPTSAWGHFRKMLDSAPLALRVPLLQARLHSDKIYLSLAFFCSGIAASCKYEYILFSLVLFITFFFTKPESKKILYAVLSFLTVPVICLFVLFLQGLSIIDIVNYIEILKNFVHQPYLQKVYATSFYFDIRAFITSLKNFFIFLIAGSLLFCIFKKSDETKQKVYKYLLFLTGIAFVILCIFSADFLNFTVYESVSYLPLLLLTLVAIKFKEILKDKNVFLLILSALVISSKCFWYLANNFYGRYFLPLLVVALFIILYKYCFKPEYQTYLQKSLIFIVVLLGLCSFRLNLAGLIVRSTPLKTPAGTIYSQKNDAQSYNSVLNYVIDNTKPDETIVVLGAAPLINFVVQRNSINFYNHFDEAIFCAYGEEKIISAYTKTMPDYFIIFRNKNKNYDFCSTYGAGVCKFIQNNYKETLKTDSKDADEYVLIYKNKKG